MFNQFKNIDSCTQILVQIYIYKHYFAVSFCAFINLFVGSCKSIFNIISIDNAQIIKISLKDESIKSPVIYTFKRLD